MLRNLEKKKWELIIRILLTTRVILIFPVWKMVFSKFWFPETAMGAQKKVKKSNESINSRLALVMKSGKVAYISCSRDILNLTPFPLFSMFLATSRH